ncbi:hypothetical protein LGK95_00105 [Clostridium algoriphilum]|uniref:hypothetical protein n=1 Tax=Clostridium algoriphilum TaxID=198347 RepID=UPI001CF5CFF1|nr:hypothetical protein [Clostridium algoriphilum]MCB2291940.1 hypothetical protein [Clostridium algoriphilum]
MGIGYLVGCLLSILLWKLDRQRLFNIINLKIKKKIENIYVLQFLYFFVAIFIYIGLVLIKDNQVYNAITAFMVIDISNTERKNLNHTEKKHFYDTISTISRALICGFITPLFYIAILGNGAGIIFTLLYNLGMDEDLNIISKIVSIASIIPSVIAELFLYTIYIFRNRNLRVKFKGDYISNLWRIPLLNVDILAAYTESVNFYSYYNGDNMHHLKSYGDYSNKIDDVCIKDYLSISYSICFIVFTIFVVLQLL